MTKLISIGCITALALGLMAHHNGVAEQQNKDRTGAPGSQPVCSACHSGGNFNVEPFVMMTDLENTTEFTTYTPGETYLLQIILNETTGGAAGFGFQSTVVDGAGTSVGNFSNPSSNGQLEFAGGRDIFEHNDLSSSNTFTVEWTAPAAGTGDVTLYFAGIAANGNGGTGGDALYTGQASWAEGASNVADAEGPAFAVSAVDGAIFVNQIQSPQPLALRVFDAMGREVAQATTYSVRSEISTSGWPTGAYIIKVSTESPAPASTFRVYVH